MLEMVTVVGSVAGLDMVAADGMPVRVSIHRGTDGGAAVVADLLPGTTLPPLAEPYGPTSYIGVTRWPVDDQGLYGGALPWSDGAIYAVDVPGDGVRFLACGSGPGMVAAGVSVNFRDLTAPAELVTPSTTLDALVGEAVADYLTAHPPMVAIDGTVAIKGKQLLDPTQTYGPGTGWTASSTTTGGPSATSTYAAYTATRPVLATPGATYTAQRVGGVIFFDAAGNRATWHSASPLSPITVTAPATAVSVAVNYPTADAALVQLEAGPTASPVEPFYITIPNLAGPGGTPYLPPDKRAPLALSLAGSVSTITAATQHVRVPFKAPAPIKRARLHLRNYNDLFGLTYTGAVALAGVHIGVHALAAAGDLTGNFTADPKQVIASATTPSDGAEYVSDWFTLPTHSTGDDLLLSYGFTTDGTTTIHRGIGGCWTSTAHTEAAQPTPATAMTAGYQPPLDVWLECEVDGRVAVVLYLGDSLTAGYGAQWPIYDSWATRHALANGAWPWVNGHTGSSLYQWSSTPAYWRWAKHNGMSAPDAAIIAGGSNDIAYDRTDMQTTLATVVDNIRAKGTRRIHLATVMPRNFDATKETARTDYNAWLRTLPLGAVQTWDFSRAVESAPGAATLDSAVNFDGTHLNRGGYARMAAVVTGTLAAWPGA